MTQLNLNFSNSPEKPIAKEIIRKLCDEVYCRAELFSEKWERRIKNKNQRFLEISNDHTFLNEFFEIFGRDRSEVAIFEYYCHTKRADLLWLGILLIEMKTPGEDLSDARSQVNNQYLPYLKDKNNMPEYIMISDFNNLELYKILNKAYKDDSKQIFNNNYDKVVSFPLNDLKNHLKRFSFMYNYKNDINKELEYKRIRDIDNLPMKMPIVKSIRKKWKWLSAISFLLGILLGITTFNHISGEQEVADFSVG